jgi:hypothetical protein
MKGKGNLKRSSAKNIIISSLVWASVIIACSAFTEGSNHQITYILLAGFFVEFIRINSASKLAVNTNKGQGS